jgi:hypothetical protein
VQSSHGFIALDAVIVPKPVARHCVFHASHQPSKILFPSLYNVTSIYGLANFTSTYTFAATITSHMIRPTADVSLLLLKSTHSSAFSKSGPVASDEHMVASGLELRLGLRTDIIRLLDVSNISGSVMNGSAMDSTTCDATRRVLIPSRPTTTATINDGTTAIRRVMKRRRMG